MNDDRGGQAHKVISPRRARINTSPFEVAVGAAALVTGVLFVCSPGTMKATNLATLVPLWANYVINIGYAVGGATILVGIWRGHRDWESAGLWLLASALAIGVVVLVEVRGWAATASIISQAFLAIASMYRSVILRKYRLAVLSLAEADAIGGGEGHEG